MKWRNQILALICLLAFAALGVQTFVIMPGAPNQAEQMRRIARDIMPAFAAG